MCCCFYVILQFQINYCQIINEYILVFAKFHLESIKRVIRSNVLQLIFWQIKVESRIIEVCLGHKVFEKCK